MSRLISLVFCFFFALNVHSQIQDSTNPKRKLILGAHFQYHPYDFFLVTSLSLQKKQMNHEIRFGTGINRTFFQQRFYPQLSYHFSYSFIENRSFNIFAFARSSFSCLRFQATNTKPLTKWVDGTFGFGVLYGTRNRIGCSIGVGPSWEFNYNSTIKRQQSVQTWNLVYELSFYRTIHD